MNLKWVLSSVVIVSLLLVSCTNTEKYVPFAQCLTEKNVTMYGAYWCPHCLNQKKMFGDAWEFVNYVECSLPGGKGQTEFCQQKEIKGYPLWEFQDGTRKGGELTFQELSSRSGCPLPG